MTNGPLRYYNDGTLVGTVVDPRFGTGAAPTQPSGWGGGSTGAASKDDQILAVYNAHPGNTRHWRAGVARARAGAGDVGIYTRGDSTSQYGVSGSPSAWWEHAAVMLGQRLDLPVERVGSLTSASTIVYDGVGTSGQTQRPTYSASDPGNAVDAASADVFVIAYGINDYSTNVNVATYKANLTSYVNGARTARPNMDIWLRGIPPVFNPSATTPVAQYRAAMLEVADDLDLPVLRIDLRWGTDVAKAVSLGVQGADHVHPTGAGKWEQGQALAGALAALV